jgi:hypothetical protein
MRLNTNDAITNVAISQGQTAVMDKVFKSEFSVLLQSDSLINDKVPSYYLFHSQCRLHLISDISQIIPVRRKRLMITNRLAAKSAWLKGTIFRSNWVQYNKA